METVLQLNLSTMATAGTEESGHYKEVTIVEIGLNKSQCMDCPSRQKLNNGFCREVAIVVRWPSVEVRLL